MTTSPLPHIPVLRFGRVYESLDKIEVAAVGSGRPLVAISQANAGLIRRDLGKIALAGEALRRMTCRELLDVCARAADLFMNAALPLGEGATQSPEDYVAQLSASSALPHTLVRRNMAKVRHVLAEMPAILDGLTRGLDLSILDRGLGEQSGAPVSFYPVARSLGAVLPSNSPGVNSIWLPAIALKTPVVLKPGREEPWTPYRIIQALIAGGAPAKAFGFYPCDHDGAAAILNACDRALLFGDEQTTAPHAANPAIQIHGPGRSKVLIGEDLIDEWPEYLDVLVGSIVDNGGRSCINASAIVVPRHGDAIADALARRLAEIEPRPLDDPRAALAGFANPTFAESIDVTIEQGLASPGAEDATARHRNAPRRALLDGVNYLRPTLARCAHWDHPLANREFLFPYASLLETPQAEMLERIGPSLVVTAITRDAAFIEALLRSPLIERLNLGAVPTSRVEWNQPHEGNLFEFLYRRRAVQLEPAQSADLIPHK